MGYIDHIAYFQGVRDEGPNKELAGRLAESGDRKGIEEIAGHLRDKNPSVASDCIAVLYHVGYEKPELIAAYVDTFLGLVSKSNNRLTWGGMIALACVARLVPGKVFAQRDLILERIGSGTVITNVWGVKTLIELAKVGDEYYRVLGPELLKLQRTCRPIDFPKRAEDMAPVIKETDREAFISILEENLPNLSKAGAGKVRRLVKSLRAAN